MKFIEKFLLFFFLNRTQSLAESDGSTYSFNMSALSNILRNLQEKNRSLPFFNFGILKYEVKRFI
jgi:hypothetical protein